MVLIFALASAAAAALAFYNRLKARDADRAETVVTGFRQSTGVLLAFTTGVRAIFDALQMIKSAIGQPSGPPGSSRIPIMQRGTDYVVEPAT